MRLLFREHDGSLAITQNYVDEDKMPDYAILSHTWFTRNEDEVTYSDITSSKALQKVEGLQKINFCGEQAAKDGLHYFWVDTCCIDKASSVELQEAVTSMFNWYRKASRCYALLTDVSATATRKDGAANSTSWEDDFRGSRWFTRGWTLQELLAPRSVEFFSNEGIRLGSKDSLQELVHETTRIPREALQGASLSDFPVPERLSWAKHRQTTRKEDRAYALLGIFSVFMPLIYGEGDHAFDRLQDELDKTHRVVNMDALMESLPVSSSAAFNSRDNQYAPTCLANTRVELLQDISDWIDGADERSIYWLNGFAGTGKSTIARTIARRYHDRGKLGGSFFFSRGGGDASHADMVFTTLASQLTSRIPSTKKHICNAITEHKDIAQLALRDQWEELIIKPMMKLERAECPSAVVLVLDALDECDSERDIQIMLRQLATTKTLRSTRLRILITSRPEITVRSGFQQIPESDRQGFVLHDIPLAQVDRDLSLFFEDEFTMMRRERSAPATWPGAQLISRLVENSGGLFIWASTACRYIRNVSLQIAMKRILQLISGIRSGMGPEKQLDQIYTTVLQETLRHDYDDDEKAELIQRLKQILGSLVLLSSPLSARALAALLATDEDTVIETLAELHTIFDIPDDHDRPIRLHHPTIRDFLLDEDRCSNLGFWIDEKEACNDLAHQCTTLMSATLKGNICDLQSPGILATHIDRDRIQQCLPSELQYACLYWAEHFRKGGIRLRDGDNTHTFFNTHFLHWLEALSLMRKTSAMMAIVRSYQALLTPADNSVQIPFVKDARRFMVSAHSMIENIPLQVYCAALVFMKPSNQLRDHFSSQIRPWLHHACIAGSIIPEAKDDYNFVNDLAFTPDGRELASGSIDEWVRVWDVGTKSALTKYEGQIDKVSSVAISPNGKLLASGSDDSTVMVWNMVSKTTFLVLTDHTRWVNTVKFSPDGKLLASGSMDETLRIWDLAHGKEYAVLNFKLSGINSVAFSADNTFIAAGTVDGKIPLWDVRKRTLRMVLDGHSSPVNSVQVSPNGKRIASGGDDTTIRLWDAVSGAELAILKDHTKKVWAVAFSHDARTLVSGSEDRTIKIWDPESKKLLRTLTGHNSGINAVTYAPNGRLLASCSFNDEVMLWDAQTGKSRGMFADFEEDAEPGASQVLASPTLQSKLPVAQSRGYMSSVACLVCSPDGQLVASGSRETTVKLWTRDGANRGTLDDHEDGITSLAFSPDGRSLASASIDKTVKLWNPETGTLIRTLAGHSAPVRLLRFSPNGRVLATCSPEDSHHAVIIWNMATGAAISKLQKHQTAIRNFAISPDSRAIASCSEDGAICVSAIDTAETHFLNTGVHAKSVNSVAFSSDGELLVSCSSDGTIRLWDGLGIPRGTLEDRELIFHSAALSTDNRLAVSSSSDEVIRIWDLETGVVTKAFRPGVVVTKVAFSTCGQFVETDRGSWNLGSASRASPRLLSQGPRTLFVKEQWIDCDGRNTLFLPDEFHASAVAIWNHTAILGHESGAVSFLEF